MTVSKYSDVEEARGQWVVGAVDVRGRIWVHSNPAKLYRFLHARNLLLDAIAACTGRSTPGP